MAAILFFPKVALELYQTYSGKTLSRFHNLFEVVFQAGWEWGGCSEDARYGAQLSRDFVDATDLSSFGQDEGDGARLMNLHNNEAGRKVRNLPLISTETVSGEI